MKRFKQLLTASLATAVMLSAMALISLAGNAKAVACYQYDPNGFQTSQTPVFNNVCGVTSPLSSTDGNYPLGDERDFVRIRPNTSGSPLGANNPKLANSLTSACDNGNKFDIWTYIHNDAEPQFNDNGNGTGVAHNVHLATNAPINTTNNHFSFSSTVSASNAASVSDSAVLNCNGQAVKLTMVPGSVSYNNNLSQTAYGSLSDSVVNGSTALGNPVWQSGNVWGCWDYRAVIVYQVTVEKIQQPQATAKCDLFTIAATEDRRVKVSQFKYTADNANFQKAVIDWGDNSSKTITDANAVNGQTHQYQGNGPFVINLIVTFTANGQTITSGGAGTACSQQVAFSSNQPPSVTPPTTPSNLVNTGPGSVAAAFAAATTVGALAYRRILSRRLSQ
jgi:hypothetical protein